MSAHAVLDRTCDELPGHLRAPTGQLVGLSANAIAAERALWLRAESLKTGTRGGRGR
jgi:hypothetical protein